MPSDMADDMMTARMAIRKCASPSHRTMRSCPHRRHSLASSHLLRLQKFQTMTIAVATTFVTVTAIAPMPSMLVPIAMMTSFSQSPMTDRTTNVTNSLRLLMPSLCENTKRMDAK